MKKILLPLIMGSIFGALTVFLVEAPVQAGAVSIFTFPGFILGIIAAGNVHDPNPGVAAAGNFFFYFALTYLAIWFQDRRIRREKDRQE